MEEELQPLPPAENEAEEESDQTDEVAVEEEPTGEDIVKQEDLDYEAELTELQAKLDKKDEIIAHKNRAIESLKKRGGATDEVLAEIANIKERADKEIQSIKQAMVSDVLDEEINRVALNASEANLIRFHLENSVRINGYTRSQIRDAVSTAKLKANEKKFNIKLNEMAVALKAKATTETTRSASSVKVETPDKPKLNSKEKELLKAFGVEV